MTLPYTRPASEGGGVITTVPFEQWLYRHIEEVGENVIIEFVDPTMTGEYRMTMDPSEKDALLYVPGDWPVTSADTPKAGATVQPVIPGGVLISVPLAAYGDHTVIVSALSRQDARV